MTPGTSAGGLTPFDEDTLWATVVGQEAAVTLLRTAACSPVHAYLLVGPPGAGRGEAARAFAGSLFASGVPDGPDSPSASRHRRLSAIGHHPDLLEVEPEGRSLLVADAKGITVEGWRSPVEATLSLIHI